MKILIVEDEILIQKSLCHFFQLKGAEVQTTSSGIEAIRLIESFCPNTVLCDLMLKDITGFDIYESYRTHPNRDKLAFYFMTAYISDIVQTKAQQLGIPLLKKPFKDLMGTIDWLIEDYKTHEQI